MTVLGLEHIPDHDDVEHAPGPGSALDHIRRMYREAKGAPRLTLNVPGPIGEYVKVRYRPVNDEFQRPSDAPAVEVALDFLIDCCDAVLIKGADGWDPLTRDSEPVRFDETLSDLLGLGVPSAENGGTARDVVLAVYGWAPKPRVAVLSVFERLSQWMAGGKEVDEERLLGES